MELNIAEGGNNRADGSQDTHLAHDIQSKEESVAALAEASEEVGTIHAGESIVEHL